MTIIVFRNEIISNSIFTYEMVVHYKTFLQDTIYINDYRMINM